MIHAVGRTEGVRPHQHLVLAVRAGKDEPIGKAIAPDLLFKLSTRLPDGDTAAAIEWRDRWVTVLFSAACNDEQLFELVSPRLLARVPARQLLSQLRERFVRRVRGLGRRFGLAGDPS